jgi:hypothetical protein
MNMFHSYELCAFVPLREVILWATWRRSILAAALLALTLAAGAAGALPPARLALVSTQRSAPADQVLALSEAELSTERDLELLDRSDIQRVIEEQQLSAGGFLDPRRAIAVGRLLTADLFAVVEAQAGTEEVVGVIVYDPRTGVRLCDVALAPGAIEATVAALAEGVRLALRKQRLVADKAWTVCVLGVRNADLPRTCDPWCSAIAGLLERRLVQCPTLTLLERSHLGHANRERDLTGGLAAGTLITALAQIEIELSRGDSRQEVRAVGVVSDAAGRRLHQVTARTQEGAAGPLADALADGILKALAQPLLPEPSDRGREARRFHHEAQVLLGNACYDQAVPAAEAALALVPDDPDVEGTLTGALVELARSLLEQATTTTGGRRGYAEAAGPAIVQAAQHAVRALEVGQHAFARAAAARRVEPMYPNAQRHGRLRTRLVPLARELAAARQEVPTPEVVHLFAAFRQAWIDYCDEAVRGWQAIVEAGEPNPFVPFWKELTLDQFQILASASLDSSEYTVQKIRLCNAWLQSLAEHFEEQQAFDGMDLFAHTTASCLNPSAHWTMQPTDWHRLNGFLRTVAVRHNHPAFLWGSLRGRGLVAQASGQALPAEYGAELQKLRETLKAYLSGPEYASTDRGADRSRRRELYNAFFSSAEWPWTGEADTARDAAVREMIAFMRQRNEVVQSLLAHTERLQRAGEERWPEIIAELQDVEDWLNDPQVQVLDWDKDSFSQRIDAIRRPLLERRPDLAPQKAATPWRDMRKILSMEQLGADGRLCFPRLDPQGRVTVLAVLYNRPDREAYRLLRLPAEGGTPERLNSAPRLRRTNVEGGQGPCVCADAQCFYLGSSEEGILALPLDGTPARQFNTDTGLPSNKVTALAALDGRLYVGTGGYLQDGLLLALDLEHGEVSVLASSRRKFRQSPFDDSEPFLITQMVADPEKHRLLFVPAGPPGHPDGGPRSGLWEYTPATGAFRQITTLPKVNDPVRTNPAWKALDPGHWFLFGDRGLQAFHLREDCVVWIANNAIQGRDMRLIEADNLVHRFVALGDPFVFEPDALWSYYPFGRVSLATQVFEEFQRPSAVATRQGWIARQCRWLQPLGDGRRLLYGDGGALWVLTPGTEKERQPEAIP